MSTHALPMLFFNLGGEMLYVLDQRLRAQNVPLLKGRKVMADIVGTMFKKNFMEDLFKPQSMYSRHAMRTIFDRLVHSSIMRVDTESMEKLYDLMIMAFKYQIIRCPSPRDLLHITLNHLDAILQFVSSSPEIRKLVTEVFQKSVELYDNMSIGELVMIRQSLLSFLQDSKNKVSIFVNSKSQNHDGTFVVPKSGNVPIGTDVPGKITIFQEPLEVKTFVTGCMFSSSEIFESISVEIGGPRSTKLGTNLYANDHSYEQLVKQDSYQTSNQNLAKAELSLLGHLMGAQKHNSSECFKLDLFGNSNESEGIPVSQTTGSVPTQNASRNVISIKAVKSGGEELSQIMDEFNITSKPSENNEDDDLLSLMDNS